MESLRRALGRLPQPPNQAAAAIIACAKEALHQILPSTHASRARAISIQDGNLVVGVTHSAIAGSITLHSNRIITTANQLILRRFPHQQQRITSIQTRIMPLLDRDRE